jgi:hypothetical protein
VGALLVASLVLAWPSDDATVDVAGPATTEPSPSPTDPPTGPLTDTPAVDSIQDLGSIEVPFPVKGLGEAFGSLWVVGGEIDTEESGGLGHVLRIDPSTGQVLDDIRVTGQPTHVAFSSSSVWVRTAGWMAIPPTVVEISPNGSHHPIETTTEGDGGLAASDSGVWFIDGAGSFTYSGDDGGYTGGLLGSPLFVGAGDDLAVVTGPNNGEVFVANVRGGGVKVADLGIPLASSIVVDEHAWIRGQDSRIHVVGTSDGAVEMTIDVGTRTRDLIEVDAGILALAIDGSAFLIDPESGSIEALPGWSASAAARGVEPDTVWTVVDDSPTTVTRGRAKPN